MYFFIPEEKKEMTFTSLQMTAAYPHQWRGKLVDEQIKTSRQNRKSEQRMTTKNMKQPAELECECMKNNAEATGYFQYFCNKRNFASNSLTNLSSR